ncbi:nucleoside phosphorylase [Streptomyces sp. NPDC091377]|uniref:nucleoside phosphorylase n=1 Tax=Streptomyces sp. NPDC091377 TaxID=3365995 RepID=UPI003814E250
MARSAQDPWHRGAPPHLPVGAAPEALPPVCLLPGDPARVDLAAEMLDDFHILGQNREFRIGTGQAPGGRWIAVCSTGIGGPSTEIAVVELARLGVKTVLRTGGMGALTSRIPPGTVCATTRAVPGSGAASHYPGDPEGPAAHPAVLATLRRAARDLDVPLIEISVATVDSYYLGQGRPLPGHEARAAARMDVLRGLGVDGVEMETETVLAVAGALGMRAGAVLVAHANRATDGWLEDYRLAQLAMLRVAVGAAALLSDDDDPQADTAITT